MKFTVLNNQNANEPKKRNPAKTKLVVLLTGLKNRIRIPSVLINNVIAELMAVFLYICERFC